MGSAIRDYEDINENLRYWFERAFGAVRDPIFYDIGANDGVFTTSFASRCQWVHAFEPAAEAAGRLADALRFKKIDNVTVHAVGLSDSAGTETLYRYSDDTFNTLYQRTDFELAHYSLKPQSAETITMHRLDEYCMTLDLPSPDVIKIDIEGAELFALRGAAKTIQRARPFLVVEYSVDNTENAGYDRSQIATILESWDYRVGGLFRNRDTRLRFDETREDRSVWNLVCAPMERRALLE